LVFRGFHTGYPFEPTVGYFRPTPVRVNQHTEVIDLPELSNRTGTLSSLKKSSQTASSPLFPVPNIDHQDELFEELDGVFDHNQPKKAERIPVQLTRVSGDMVRESGYDLVPF
jgi:hypothetical protein